MTLVEINDELVTEITSEVDVLLSIGEGGLSLSVYLDEEHFSEDISWDTMAEKIIEDYHDGITYDEEYDIIIEKFEQLAKDLRDARGE